MRQNVYASIAFRGYFQYFPKTHRSVTVGKEHEQTEKCISRHTLDGASNLLKPLNHQF